MDGKKTTLFDSQLIAEALTRKIKLKNVTTGNPGSVIVPQYGSSKIAVFVLAKNTILKFVGNTK